MCRFSWMSALAAAQRPRDHALLRRGELGVTEVCFAVGRPSLGTFGTGLTELADDERRTSAEVTAEDIYRR